MMRVKVEFDRTNRTIKTYVNDRLTVTGNATEAHDAYFTNTLRMVVAPYLVAKIDNLKVTTMGASPEVLMNETFEGAELLNATTKDGILGALDWEISTAETTTYNSNGKRLSCENGALILGRRYSGQEHFTLVQDSEDAKNGFVVEYDFEFIYTSGAGTAQKGISFHSAKAGSSSWASQFRWGKNVGSGIFGASDWVAAAHNLDKTYNSGRIQSVATGNANSMLNSRVAVRAVFDPATGYVTTYAKAYTGEALTWSEEDAVQKSPYLEGQEDLLDGTVRLVIDSNILVCIDNIKVTALEKTPNAVGIQKHTTENKVRLLGVIDNDIFTKAEAVGFRVTMTKDGSEPVIKDIDCNYVYSSITAWGTEPTTAAGFMNGASHIYALHIKDITENATIEVTPYYVDEGVKYFGDASETIEYTPVVS